MHALCECGADSTERLIEAVEARFGHLLGSLRWLNLGPPVDPEGVTMPRLIRVLNEFRASASPGLELVLEPGAAAIAWDTGVLVSQVLDLISNAEALDSDSGYISHRAYARCRRCPTVRRCAEPECREKARTATGWRAQLPGR